MNNIIMAVVNTAKNEELLRRYPHREVCDLSIIYKIVLFETPDSLISYVVTNELLKDMNISKDKLHALAVAGMVEILPARVLPLGETLVNMDQLNAEELDEDNIPLYIINNRKKIHGAASIFAQPHLLEQLAEQVGCDLYLLPSSVHEFLAVPCAEANVQGLRNMVYFANRTEVAADEVLSDNVYLYSGGKISIAE